MKHSSLDLEFAELVGIHHACFCDPFFLQESIVIELGRTLQHMEASCFQAGKKDVANLSMSFVLAGLQSREHTTSSTTTTTLLNYYNDIMMLASPFVSHHGLFCEVKVFNIVALSILFCFLSTTMKVQDNWFRKGEKDTQVEINHSFKTSS